MYRKIIGYLLLALGVFIILWTLIVSYNIFTGKTAIPEIFKVENGMKNTEETITPKANESTQAIQFQMETLIKEQLQNLIPEGSTETLLNLGIWSMLAFILMSGGSKLTSIGINLIKQV